MTNLRVRELSNLQRVAENGHVSEGVAGVEGLAQAILFNAKGCLTIPKQAVSPLSGLVGLSNR
jgi:hypothetical protein